MILLADASNAFNWISSKTFFYKIGIICPLIRRYVRNCYNLSPDISIIGGRKIRSTEGTSIRNPTAIAIYTIAIILLFLMLVDIIKMIHQQKQQHIQMILQTQLKLTQLKKWWDTWCVLGPKLVGTLWKEIKSMQQKNYNWRRSKLQQTVNDTEVQLSNPSNINVHPRKHTFSQNGSQNQGIHMLFKIASFESQAAYSWNACLLLGLNTSQYFVWETIFSQLKRLDDLINTEPIQTVSGGIICLNN